MRGKVVVITGAGGVLGGVLVALAQSRGAQVVAIYAAPPGPEPDDGRMSLHGVDLADPIATQGAIDAVLGRHGRIDVLLNAVGGFVWRTTADADPAAWERMHRLNLLTVLNACRAALPALIASGQGRIVNVGAFGAVTAGAGMGCYAAAKAGVHRLTEALAEEVRDHGLTVNAVLPTVLDTAANRADMPDADPARWVRPEALAEVMLFLASEQAGAVTGALVPVRGRL